jgi:phosphonopyruvate decarboxylase
MHPLLLCEAANSLGVQLYCGVACSSLDPLLTTISRIGAPYIAASGEGEAVGIAAGAWLGGAPAAVVMQNSGLGNAVNPLASLAIPYRIPLLLVISWRGEPGRGDAAHHLPMGCATLPILESLGIRSTVVRGADDLPCGIAAARDAMETRREPYALVLPVGSLERVEPLRATRPSAAVPASLEAFEGRGLPTRAFAVQRVADLLPGVIVSTTGYISRDVGRRVANGRAFMMQGSMGCASAIGLGVAAAGVPHVAVLDGDGALVMRLGMLATIGRAAPQGMIHVVLDDGIYASTGGQEAPSAGVDFGTVASACGYAAVAMCSGADVLDEALGWARRVSQHGPVLVHVRISADQGQAAGRPEAAPSAICDAFRAYLQQAAAPATLETAVA